MAWIKIEEMLPVEAKKGEECSFCGDKYGLRFADGKYTLCNRHRLQYQRYGAVLDKTIYDKNLIKDCGSYCEVTILGKYGEKKGVALVDASDKESISKYKWCYNHGYAVYQKHRAKKASRITMHGLIMGKKKGYEIDHINRNKMDNRRCNLRFATRSENTINKEFVGVSFYTRVGKWAVQIRKNGKRYWGGYFTDKKEALEQRTKMEKLLYPSFFIERTQYV